MGRPLNKRNFGTSAKNTELKVQFFNGTASVNGWIEKQLGSRKFRCTDGTATADCLLTDKLAAALTAGEMSISVKDDAGVVKQIVKIAAKKVTLNSGESIAWNFSNSIIDGAVESEESGGQAIDPIIAVTAAVNGTTYIIVEPGDTDFTTFGAADSNVDTSFTMANSPGTGTGTVKEVAPETIFGT